VSGIPIVFAERALAKTLPTQWLIEDASLVIDDSAEIGVEQIDRDRGIGVGLDFTLKLLDTDAVRDWLRRWSQQCTLTANLNPGDAVVTVDDTSGFDAAGEIHIGLERIAYTGTTATTFTGLTRATCNSLECQHKTGTTGQVVTDRPRFWRGRDVTLWASMADPSGYVCGTALVSQEATQLWRGRIASQPERHNDGFSFNCQSLDRALDEKLGAKISGEVYGGGDSYLLIESYTIRAYLVGANAAGATIYTADIKFSPFKGLFNTYKTTEQIRTLISSSFGTAVAAAGAGAHVGAWVWDFHDGKWKASIDLIKDVLVYGVNFWLWLDGEEWSAFPVFLFPAGMLTDFGLQLNIFPNDVPIFSPNDADGKALATGVDIDLSGGDPADVIPPGVVRIQSGDIACTYTFSNVGSNVNSNKSLLHLQGIKPMQGQKALTIEQLKDATVEVLSSDSGTFDVLALRCLQSSGTGLRGAYDLLERGAGYALDQSVILESTFTEAMAAGHTGNLQGQISAADSSFSDLFGGLLALFRLAIVSRPTRGELNTPVRLQIVHTAQGTEYTAKIIDNDLLSHESDPIQSVKRLQTPNTVTILRQIDGNDKPDRITINDVPSIEAIGKLGAEYKIAATDRAALETAASGQVATQFAYDQTVQALEIKVHPAIDVDAGDACLITTTHPAVWTWNASPGRVGYTGPGRCTGRKFGLKSLCATLLVLIDGSLKMRALSPAAPVLVFDVAGAPTWIEVALKYLEHFAFSISDAGGPVKILHYQPGQVESAGQSYTISAAVNVAGFCRLTITPASQIGVFNLSTGLQSTLTLPLTADVTDYQEQFAHTDDGSSWG